MVASIRLFAFYLLCSFAVSVLGTDYTWSQQSNVSWNSVNSWSPNTGYPGNTALNDSAILQGTTGNLTLSVGITNDKVSISQQSGNLILSTISNVFRTVDTTGGTIKVGVPTTFYSLNSNSSLELNAKLTISDTATFTSGAQYKGTSPLKAVNVAFQGNHLVSFPIEATNTVINPGTVTLSSSATVNTLTISNGGNLVDSSASAQVLNTVGLSGNAILQGGSQPLQISSLNVQGTSKLTGPSSILALNWLGKAGSSIKYQSSSTSNVNLITSGTGTFSVENPTAVLNFQGGTNILTDGNWQFLSCNKITSLQNITIGKEFLVQCPTELNYVSLLGTLTISSQMKLKFIDPESIGSVKAANGGSLTLTSGLTSFEKTNFISPDSGSFSFFLDGGSVDLGGKSLVNTNVYVQNALSTLKIPSVSLTSSTLELTEGDLQLSGSGIDLSGNSSLYLNKSLTLNPCSVNLQNSKWVNDQPITLGNGNITLNLGKIFWNAGVDSDGVIINAAQGSEITTRNFATNAAIDISNSVYFHNGTDSTLTISGSGLLSINSGTFISEGTVNIGAGTHLTGSYSSASTLNNAVISGSLIASSSTGTINVGGITTLNGGVIQVQSGLIALNQLNAVNSEFIAEGKPGGTIRVGSGSITGGTISMGANKPKLVISGALSLSGTTLSLDASSVVEIEPTGSLTIQNLASQFTTSMVNNGVLNWAPTGGSDMVIGQGASILGSGSVNILSNKNRIKIVGTGIFEAKNLKVDFAGFSASDSARIRVKEGSVALNTGLTIANQVQLDFTGSDVTFSTLKLQGDSSLIFGASSRSLSLSGGSASFDDNSAVQVNMGQTLYMNGAYTLNGGSVTVASGSVLQTSGTMDFSSGGVVFVESSSRLRVDNTGSVSGTAADISGYHINGTLEVVGGGTITFGQNSMMVFGATSQPVITTGGGKFVFGNGATLVRTEGCALTWQQAHEHPFYFQGGTVVNGSAPWTPTFGFYFKYTTMPCQGLYYDEFAYSDLHILKEGCVIIDTSYGFSAQGVSSVTIEDNGKLYVKNSAFNLDGSSSLNMLRNATLSLSSNSNCNWNSPVYADMNDYNHPHIELSKSTLNLLASMELRGNTWSRVYDQSTLSVTGTLEVGDSSKIEVQGSSNLKVDGVLTLHHLMSVSNSKVNLGGNLEIISSANASFATSSLTTSGSVFLSQASGLNLLSSSNMNMTAGQIDIIDSSSMTLGSSNMTISAGSVNLLSGSKFALDSGSIATIKGDITIIDNSYLPISGSSVLSLSNSDIGIEAGGSLLVTSKASLSVSSNTGIGLKNSAFNVDDGSVNINQGTIQLEQSLLDIRNGGTFDMNVGLISIVSEGKLSLNAGKLSINSGGEIHLEDISTATAEASSEIQILAGGVVSASGDTKVTVDQSKFILSGDLFLLDRAETDITTNGEFTLKDAGVLDMFGTSLLVSDYGKITVSGLSFQVHEYATVLLKAQSLTNITSGISMTDFSELQMDGKSQMIITDRNLTLSADSKLALTDASSISIAGGSAIFEGKSSTSFLKSTLSINAGESICRENAKISLAETSWFDVTINSGVAAHFKDYCVVEVGTSSTYRTGGSTHFSVNSTVTLLPQGQFEVIQGNSEWTEFSKATIGVNAVFSVNGGNAVFQDESFIQVENGGKFNVITGNATVMDTAHLNVLGSPVTVDGNFFQQGDSKIDLQTAAKLSITSTNGLFISSENSKLSLVGTSQVEVGGSSNLILQDDVLWTVQNSKISLSGGGGTISLHDNAKIQATSGEFDFNGNFESFSISQMDLSSSIVKVTGGNVTFWENTTLLSSGTASSFTVVDGSVTFADLSSSTFNGGEFRVENSVNLKDQSQINFTDAFFFVDGSNSIFEATSFAKASFDSSPLDLSGSLHFRDDSILTFLDTTSLKIKINGASEGDFALFNRAQFLTPPGVNIDIEGGGFELHDVVSVQFNQAQISIDGTMTLLHDSQLSLSQSNVLITSGDLTTRDSHKLNVIDSSVEVSGSLNFFGTSTSEHYFFQTPFSVKSGNITFAEDTHPFFENCSEFSLNSGSVIWTDQTNVTLQSTPFSISAGSFFGRSTSKGYFLDSPLSIDHIGGVIGTLLVTDQAELYFRNSPISLIYGYVTVESQSVLTFADAATTLVVQDGSFTLDHQATFNTVPGTQISIEGGEFSLQGQTIPQFNQVFIEVTGGNFQVIEQSSPTFSGSSITVESGGTFLTQDDIQLRIVGNTEVFVNGPVNWYGTSASSHQIENSLLTIENGDFSLFEYVKPVFTNSRIVGNGGSFIANQYSSITLQDSVYDLQGTGTLYGNDNSSLYLRGNSLVDVLSAGAVATFSDSSRVEVYDLSTFRINVGSVTFQDLTIFNLWFNTFFYLYDGSLTLRGQSETTFYPNTEGSIIGGNLYVLEQAKLTFMGSNVTIVGSIINNSSYPVEFRDGTTITLDDGKVAVSDRGVIHIVEDSYINITGGVLILRGDAGLYSNNAQVFVHLGAILFYDQSWYYATNQSFTAVYGGNITAHDNANFTITDRSRFFVAGDVYLLDDSITTLEYQSLGTVSGNLRIANQASFINREHSNATVIGGNLTMSDFSSYTGEPTSRLSIIDSGSFISSGPGVVMNFDQASALIQGGDLILSVRATLLSQNSSFSILGNGNVILTDMARAFLQEGDHMLIEGGDLEVFRQASVLLEEDSRIQIKSLGNAFLSENSYLELRTHSGLSVEGGGSVEFNDLSLLNAIDFGSVNVTGGGSVVFRRDSSANLKSSATIYVSDGGNIEFNDRAVIHSIQSFLQVDGGGSILLTGSGIGTIQDQSLFRVTGGNIIYRDEKQVNFFESRMEILSGSLQMFDNALFNIDQQTNGYVTGGNWELYNQAIVNMKNSSQFTISGGNVKSFNEGHITMDHSTISVTASGSSSSGYFSLADDSLLELLIASQIYVAGGDFESSHQARVQSTQSRVNVTGGSALFRGNSEYYASESFLSVFAGKLHILDDSLWKMVQNSTASIFGGDLLLDGRSNSFLSQSQFEVFNGMCNLLQDALLDMDDSSLTVLGGDLIYSDRSKHVARLSSIFISGGQIIYDDQSDSQMFTTNITVHLNGPRLQTRLPGGIQADDLIIVGGESRFCAQEQSEIWLVLGNFVFLEQATSCMIDSLVHILGGSMKLSDTSETNFNNTNVNITSGSFEVFGNGTMNTNGTLIDISGGDFKGFGDSVLNIGGNSVIQINNGSALFDDNSNVDFKNSGLHVNDTGSIGFQGDTKVNVLQSHYTLSGKGIFQVGDRSNFLFNQSLLEIFNGTFRSMNDSKLNFHQSRYIIWGGDTWFHGRTQVNLHGSNFSVFGGNVYLLDQSSINIFDGSNYEVDGGNVYTLGSSVLNLVRSCFNVTRGSVKYSESSKIILEKSCWHVAGGDVYLQDRAEFSLYNASSLRIIRGTFNTTGEVSLNLFQSIATVTGGNFLIHDRSSLKIMDSVVDVTRGIASFHGDSFMDVQESTFRVSGGLAKFLDRSNLRWINSTLTVNLGDMITSDQSRSRFLDSKIAITGGGLKFQGASIVDLLNSEVNVNIGSIQFLNQTAVKFNQSFVNVIEGDIQFGEQTLVEFLNSRIYLSGLLSFLGSSKAQFQNVSLSIVTGSLNAKNHAQVSFRDSTIKIAGTFHASEYSSLEIFSSKVSIAQGDLVLSDEGSFLIRESSVNIKEGNWIVQNAGYNRKSVMVIDSQISVDQGGLNQDGDFIAGNMEIDGNVDVTLHRTLVEINGNLIMSGDSKLNIHEDSIFSIPYGVVLMDINSVVDVDTRSALLNQGQLFAPGSLSVPVDSSFSNEGFFEANHDFNANCFDERGERAPLSNSGTFRFNSKEGRLQSCVDSLQHSGLMQVIQSNVTFNRISTTKESWLNLMDSFVGMEDSEGTPFSSNGNVGGKGTFVGSFHNEEGAVVMPHGDSGVTRLEIENQFNSKGDMMFVINSRDLADQEAFSHVRTGGNAQLRGGRVCICLDPSLRLFEGDKWDLLKSQTQLLGEFDEVEFDCADCPVRRAKSAEASSSECSPKADYGARSFSVLFESCDGGSGNYFDSISPPWYVIFPVAVGIILCLIIVFGGALLVDEKLRKKKFKKKVKSKRTARLQKMINETSGARSSSSLL